TAVINDWTNDESWENGRPVKLRAGTAPIVLAYFNKKDKPAAQIYWTGPDFMLRRLGDGDLVHKAKEIELAAPWRDPAAVAVAPPNTGAGKPPPGGTGPAQPGGAGGAPLPVGNLVANGGFEERDADRKFAARWTKGQWGKRGAKYTARIDMSNPREGGESALVARALEGGAKAGAAASLRLDPGTYRVSYWACANVGDTATIGAHLAGTDLPENSVGDQWKQFTHEAQVGTRTLGGALRVWTSTPNVRVWFDDVEVVMLRRPDPRTD
ncbi:MAG: carbohydrate binding domain-containing protein, partial [Planctomycetota bacterium]